jgi:hypothetical protein
MYPQEPHKQLPFFRAVTIVITNHVFQSVHRHQRWPHLPQLHHHVQQSDMTSFPTQFTQPPPEIDPTYIPKKNYGRSKVILTTSTIPVLQCYLCNVASGYFFVKTVLGVDLVLQTLLSYIYHLFPEPRPSPVTDTCS